jgi:hypothetical protein
MALLRITFDSDSESLSVSDPDDEEPQPESVNPKSPRSTSQKVESNSNLPSSPTQKGKGSSCRFFQGVYLREQTESRAFLFSVLQLRNSIKVRAGY